MLFRQNFLTSKQFSKEPPNLSLEIAKPEAKVQPFDPTKEEIKKIYIGDEKNLTWLKSNISDSPNRFSNLDPNDAIKEDRSPYLDVVSRSNNTCNELLSEQRKETLLHKFLTQLQILTPYRKVPNDFTKKAYTLIDDKAYWKPKHEKMKIRNIIGNVLGLLSIFLRIKKAMKKFFKSRDFIIHPYKSFRIFWDLIEMFLMIFFFFYLPLDLSFAFENSLNIRIVLSAVMLFDNWLGFSTAYFHHGKLITDRKKIFRAYIHSFIFDVFTQTSLIYDLFLKENSDNFWNRYIKLIFFVQYRKFMHIYQTVIDRFKIDMKFGYALDFIKLIATSICFMHWVACAWYSIAAFNTYSTQTWLSLQDLNDRSELDKYIYSIYWSAVTMMTVGYGDIIPQNSIETAFVTVVVIIGCGLFAYYIK